MGFGSIVLNTVGAQFVNYQYIFGFPLVFMYFAAMSIFLRSKSLASLVYCLVFQKYYVSSPLSPLAVSSAHGSSRQVVGLRVVVKGSVV